MNDDRPPRSRLKRHRERGSHDRGYVEEAREYEIRKERLFTFSTAEFTERLAAE